MVKSKPTRRMRAFLLAGEFAALGAASVILLVFLASSLDGLLVRSGQGAAVITSMLVDLANTDRSSNHVGTLIENPALTAIAQAKANDMAKKGYFAHTSPEGKSPWYWFTQGGYVFSYAGENLAVDFSDSADVERAWMNSPTHRANLLNQHFTEIGIATAVGTYEGHQTTFVVQEFATPAANTPVRNVAEVTTPKIPTDIAVATTEKNPVQVTGAPARTVTTNGPRLATGTLPSTMPASPQAVLGVNATGRTSVEPAPDARGITAFWNVFAASPKTTLRYAYYLFVLLILIALVIETGIEIRRRHMKHVFLAIGLILLMGGLFAAANIFVFTDPIVAASGEAALGTTPI
jgi:hypothetical protein